MDNSGLKVRAALQDFFTITRSNDIDIGVKRGQGTAKILTEATKIWISNVISIIRNNRFGKVICSFLWSSGGKYLRFQQRLSLSFPVNCSVIMTFCYRIYVSVKSWHSTHNIFLIKPFSKINIEEEILLYLHKYVLCGSWINIHSFYNQGHVAKILCCAIMNNSFPLIYLHQVWKKTNQTA